MSVATALTTCERSFLVNYARNGHSYLYSFDESRIAEVMELIRGQGDDPTDPLSDMDCLRLLNAVKLAPLLPVGGCLDASGSFAHCVIFCVGVANPTHGTAHEAAHVPVVEPPASMSVVPNESDNAGSLAGDIGAGDVYGCFLLVIGFCFWAFIALMVSSAVLGLNLLVSLFSLFAGR